MKLGGRVQRGVRRLLLVRGEATTAELLEWCYRGPGRSRRERQNRAQVVRRVAAATTEKVGRVWPGGNLWRLRNTESDLP
jgi:hypothetical protein